MAMTIEEPAAQAIALCAPDRARLADLRLASLPAAEDADVDGAWDQEVRGRVGLYAVSCGTQHSHLAAAGANGLAGRCSSLAMRR